MGRGTYILFTVKATHADILPTVSPIHIQEPAFPVVFYQLHHSWLISCLPGERNNVIITYSRNF